MQLPQVTSAEHTASKASVLLTFILHIYNGWTQDRHVTITYNTHIRSCTD